MKNLTDKFRFIESTNPEIEDDEYVFIANENYTIQVLSAEIYGSEKFAVNFWNDITQSMHHVIECRNLDRAMRHVIVMNDPTTVPVLN